MRQRSRGLNDGLREARDEAIAGGAAAVLILPIHLAQVTSEAIRDLVQAAERQAPPVVAIVGDRHGRGTNALFLAPADIIDVHYGRHSYEVHTASAVKAGAALLELGGPLSIDLDTPDDLLMADVPGEIPESIGG